MESLFEIMSPDEFCSGFSDSDTMLMDLRFCSFHLTLQANKQAFNNFANAQALSFEFDLFGLGLVFPKKSNRT